MSARARGVLRLFIACALGCAAGYVIVALSRMSVAVSLVAAITVGVAIGWELRRCFRPPAGVQRPGSDKRSETPS